jgi:hypothetical protein
MELWRTFASLMIYRGVLAVMQPKNLTRTTWICLIIATVALVGACQPQQDYALLTTANPVAQLADGLALSVNPTALATTRDFGVQLSAVPEATFSDSQPNAVWSKARQAVPANLQRLSPVFQIQTSGTLPPQMFVSAVVPDKASGSVGIYTWDGQAWTYLAAHMRGGQLIADVSQPPATLALFAVAPSAPQTMAVVEPGEKLASTAGIDTVLLGGVAVQPDGSLTGQLPDMLAGQGSVLYAIVRNYDASGTKPDLTSGLLNDAVVRANHLQALTSFGTSGPYTGLVLDYKGVAFDQRAAYAEFVSNLAQQLHAQGKKLMIQIPMPAAQADAALDRDRFITGSYDWRALGAAADTLLVPVAQSPADFGNGAVEALLAWASGEVERSHLALLTSAASVDGANGGYITLPPTAVIAHLGTVTANPAALTTGQAVTISLSGQARNFGYDPQAFSSRFTYNDGSEHTVWLTSAATLSQRLALAAKYGLGGAAITDLAAAGIPADMLSALAQYKANGAALASTQHQLVWTARDASGATVQATASPNLAYVYVAQAPGSYQFSAELQGGRPASLGSAEVSVANVPTPTATPRVIASTGSSAGSGSASNAGSSGGEAPPPAATQPPSTGGFVPPAPITSGSFELGGQVPGYLGHPGEMKQAKMTWVKVQNDAGMIGAGHAAGFKVLLSVVGDKSRAADPNYWSEYAANVAGLAAQGADAIEIWNEANIDREWPTGQISGATYAGLLKQAYTAIKAANSNTLVISGAPAPTGAEGALPGRVVNDDNFLRQMAEAGAANYMDCVGIHFNTGTTSPNATSGSALSGYHYSYYFWPMVNLYYDTFGGSRPLCFTELGYVSPQGYESVPLPAYFSWAAGITVANQAQWLAESASLSANSGKVKLMIVFNMDFTHYLADDPQAGYAMIRPDGSCPACAALGAVMP